MDPSRNYVEEFAELFLDAVDKRLLASDVPVGVLLSGGLDSSAVAAAAVERGHRDFHTFSVAFEDGGTFDERRYARQLAQRIGSRHHEVVIGQKDFMAFLPEWVWYTDEPLADLACVPLWAVCRLAREQVKVVLTGEGSDEILAGYNTEDHAARFARLLGLERRLPKAALGLAGSLVPGAKGQTLKRLARAGVGGYLADAGSHVTLHWREADKRSLWKDPVGLPDSEALIRSFYAQSRSDHPVDQLQQVYCHSWLVEDLLMKADRMSMAVSLEARVPFLDYRLVEWAAKLPMAWRTGEGTGTWVSKRILREFARTRLPADILTRPKQGFPVPAYEWLKGDLGIWARQRLLAADGFCAELFSGDAMARAVDGAVAGNENEAHKTWVLLVLEEWGKRWM